MDDLLNELGGTRPKTPIEEAWHQEQERKKYDIIRVANPTDKDFYVKYDTGRFQKIPAQSTIDVPRYIAVRYVAHQKDAIIHWMAQEQHDKYIKEREEKGLPRYKSKYEENEETYNSAEYPKTNDPKLMQEVMDKLWIGLVYEFGRDVPPSSIDPRSGEVDLKPAEVKIMEQMDKRRVDTSGEAPQVYQAAPISMPSIPVNEPESTPPSSFSKLNDALSANDITANE